MNKPILRSKAHWLVTQAKNKKRAEICIVNEGQFIFHILPVDFESLIHYKPFKQLSFASGLGYQRTAMSGPGRHPAWSVIENNMSYKCVFSNYRIPMQIRYHFNETPTESDTYFKVEYINNIIADKTIHYEYDILSSNERQHCANAKAAPGVEASGFNKRIKTGVYSQP